MEKHEHTSKGWWADIGKEHTVIRGPGSDSICAMKRNTGDRFEDEQDANAHMIAASVDLYEAAKEVMEDLERFGASIVPHLLDTDMNSGQRLRNAIAKAEGRS